MRFHLLLLALIGFLTPAFLHADEKAEAQFIALIREMEASGSMKSVMEIYLPGDAPSDLALNTHRNLETIVTRGIESIGFVEIYPNMKAGLTEAMTIEGRDYVINVEPYKMLEVMYSKKIEGGSSGYSVVVGKKDGRLWIAGFKAVK